MKKRFLLLSAGLLACNVMFAQWCGTDEANAKIFEDPVKKQFMEEHMTRAARGLINGSSDRSGPYVIPVVVHIIHDGGEGNISYEQILDGLEVLNEDYNRLNADTSDTRNTAEAPFLPIASDMEITFALAKIDPNGDCTNGVQRKYAPHLTNSATDDCKSEANGGLDGWPNDKYLNIWVVNSIQGSGGGTTLGYAYLPYSAPGAAHGILIRHDAFGRIGTSSSDGETLTHEAGHILGLRHTFQDDGCHTGDCTSEGDHCCDTPPADVAMFGCTPTENTCDNVPAGDYYGFDAFDQYENWMSYNTCQNMFSEDQKTIVHANLESIDFLMNWVSPSNLTATGVGLPETLCKAEFSADKNTVCAGNIVNFTDFSYFNVTGHTWSFPGGTPASSSAANPIVTYTTPGLYDVTLEVTDGSSTESITFEDYILVLADPGEPVPYKEHFEEYTTFPDNEQFMSPGGAWELTDAAAYGGDFSVYVPNYLSFDNGDKELISGTIDLSGATPGEDLIFYFDFAYRKFTASNDEALKLYVSSDCGETWTLRKNIDGDELGTESSFFPFTPSSSDEWTEMYITNINTPYFVSDFRYKFVFEANGGNNIYLDNINIFPESMLGEVDLELPLVMNVYPNPSNNMVNIELYAISNQNYEIQLFDPLGKSVARIHSGELSNGKNILQYDMTHLPSGFYVIKVESEGQVETIKLLKD